MSILVQRYFKRSRAVVDLAEEWKIHHEYAMLVFDLEELICECIELGKLATHVWTSLADLLVTAKITEIDEVGDKFRMAVERTKEALALVQQGVVKAKKDYKIDKADELLETMHAIESMSEDFEKVWPKANEQMAKEALEDYQRGDFKDSGELLANAQGYSSEKNLN